MIAEAVRAVQARTRLVPEVAIILGTGLWGLAGEVSVETSPGFRCRRWRATPARCWWGRWVGGA